MGNRSDCMVPPANCPLSPRRVTRRWHQSITSAVIMGLTGASFMIGVGWATFASIQPPVIVQNSRIMNPDIYPGEDLSFIITYMTSIDRSCVGSVTREFYTPIDIDGISIRRKKRISGAVPIVIDGETNYVIDVTLPENMAPGSWEFQGETTYDCGYLWAFLRDFPRGVLNGGVLRFRTRIMPFNVRAPKAIDRK